MSSWWAVNFYAAKVECRKPRSSRFAPLTSRSIDRYRLRRFTELTARDMARVAQVCTVAPFKDGVMSGREVCRVSRMF